MIRDIVPFIAAKTVVILVSQVKTGLIRDPFKPVPSSAPNNVCPQGDEIELCSQTAPIYLLSSISGKLPYGVTSLSKVTFWNAIEEIPEQKYPVS